jgi:3-deoxy-D-arabino-heptulosonate 7-phosphate (DAHP) synthase class II
MESRLYQENPETKRFKELEGQRFADALGFMEPCGITSDFNNRLYTVNFWTSHEALLLPFEESMTRQTQQLVKIMILQHTLFGLVIERDS